MNLIDMGLELSDPFNCGGPKWRFEVNSVNSMNDLNFILRVLKARDPYDCEDLLWSFDFDGKIHFAVKCSDVFWWATADDEEITPGNIGEFEAAKRDAAAACEMGSIYADMLFAARIRKLRPMKAAYTKHVELWPLFDACGPERLDDTTKRPQPKGTEACAAT